MTHRLILAFTTALLFGGAAAHAQNYRGRPSQAPAHKDSFHDYMPASVRQARSQAASRLSADKFQKLEQDLQVTWQAHQTRYDAWKAGQDPYAGIGVYTGRGHRAKDQRFQDDATSAMLDVIAKHR